MELVFEAQGPVVRNRVTKKMYPIYELKDPMQPLHIILNAKKVDIREIYLTNYFERIPCRIYIKCDERIDSWVRCFYYSPKPNQPIYAQTYNNFYELQDYVCNLDYKQKPKRCSITQLIEMAFNYSSSIIKLAETQIKEMMMYPVTKFSKSPDIGVIHRNLFLPIKARLKLLNHKVKYT
jgi:hypothetical protein